MILREKIIEVLKNCFDPEIPIDLWNLGLIYDIKLSDNSEKKVDVHIIMSLTTPGCSMGNSMAEDIKKQLSNIKAINSVNVEVTFDPPWNPKMMTDFAREKLGFEPTKSPKNDQKINVEWE
jgi:metal-sulfur cluster biosynthetic enzyme